MSTGLLIRRWRESDTAQLFEIYRGSIRKIASRDYSPAQIDAWSTGPDDFSERMSLCVTFVAEAGERLLGFMQYEPPDHIDMAYVHPMHQGVGVASALLAALEEEARRGGVRTLRVEASITSRPFFERRGYGEALAQVVRFHGQDFVNYRMTKRL